MNRARIAVWGLAGFAGLCSSAAIARDTPKQSFSIDPIVAPNLLAPVEVDRGNISAYRLDPGLEPSSGQRARLSIEVGDSTLYAITGRLARSPRAIGPLAPADARVLGPRRVDGGKVYGGGISHNVGGVDVSASYQYSKLHADEGETEAKGGAPGRSHSLRATARIRFKP